jgi:putative membrane protein
MNIELVLRYLHFISIFAIVGALVSEHVLLKPALTRAEIGRLARIDAVYGLAALVLVGVGLTLWLGGHGKPAVYYSKNWIFHSKLALFGLVGIFSIYPTVFFLKHRKGTQEEIVPIPKAIRWLLRLELLLLAIIPLLAGMMAKGLGYME